MIKLTAIGHIGNDAIVNQVNGNNVINFNVAHTEKFKNSEGVQTEKTIWVSCSYWVEKTTVATYLKKGTQVYVEGTPDVKTYTGSDGKTKASLILRVFSVQLLGSKEKNERADNPESDRPASGWQQGTPAQNSINPKDDDLPF